MTATAKNPRLSPSASLGCTFGGQLTSQPGATGGTPGKRLLPATRVRRRFAKVQVSNYLFVNVLSDHGLSERANSESSRVCSLVRINSQLLRLVQWVLKEVLVHDCFLCDGVLD